MAHKWSQLFHCYGIFPGMHVIRKNHCEVLQVQWHVPHILISYHLLLLYFTAHFHCEFDRMLTGTFASLPGMNQCNDCKQFENRYQPKEGQGSCLRCPEFTQVPSQAPRAIHLTDCICKEGSWRPDGKRGKECLPCPPGVHCKHGLHHLNYDLVQPPHPIEYPNPTNTTSVWAQTEPMPPLNSSGDSSTCQDPFNHTKYPSNLCSGWTPKTGNWNGTGGSCAKWGWTTEWCYVDQNYRGPNQEFVIQSDEYPGKFYVPCRSTGSGSYCSSRSNVSKPLYILRGYPFDGEIGTSHGKKEWRMPDGP